MKKFSDFIKESNTDEIVGEAIKKKLPEKTAFVNLAYIDVSKTGMYKTEEESLVKQILERTMTVGDFKSALGKFSNNDLLVFGRREFGKQKEFAVANKEAMYEFKTPVE